MAAIPQRMVKLPLNEKWRSIASRSSRTLLALGGGYGLTNGYIAFLAAGLPRLGVPPAEAAYFGLLTGLVLFVGFAVWAAATRHLVLMTGAAIALAVALTATAPIIASPGA